MIRAIEREKHEVYIGKREVMGIYLKRFFPGLLHRMMLREKAKWRVKFIEFIKYIEFISHKFYKIASAWKFNALYCHILYLYFINFIKYYNKKIYT